MPRFGNYDLMTAQDAAFALWVKELRQRFTNLSMHVRMLRDLPRDADEKTWQWTDDAYARVAAQTGADLPDDDLSRLIDRDCDILLDDERCRIWWHWAGNPFEDDVVAACCSRWSAGTSRTRCCDPSAAGAPVRLARTSVVCIAHPGDSISCAALDPDRN
ncbi:hypothetical protein [uncultured Sphingomonas sp.]|jgi:hypothetical protein|uniref:hypothetical protein n=1 Tax=uncultured Sphingomonas sp. TaxID=158754 RepID=UPI0030D6E4B8